MCRPQDLPGGLLVAGRSWCGLDTLLLLSLQLVGRWTRAWSSVPFPPWL